MEQGDVSERNGRSHRRRGSDRSLLAATLQQAGIRHVLIDKLAEGHNTSRAAVIHAHTLEVLKSIGVADQLAARELKLSTFRIRDRDRALLSLPFDTLRERRTPTC